MVQFPAIYKYRKQYFPDGHEKNIVTVKSLFYYTQA